MKVPGVRFTARRLMVVVAIVAVLLGLEGRRRSMREDARRELVEPISCVEDASTPLVPTEPDPPRPEDNP